MKPTSTRSRFIGQDPPDGRRRHRRGRRAAVIAAATALVVLAVTTARVFVWPAQGMPAHVDAIVMMDGVGGRLNTALGLAWDHRASTIVISRGSPVWGHGNICGPPLPGVRVICFVPNPRTTQGEAEFAGRLAKRYHWHSIALVAIAPQATRARLRMERCFSGKVYVVGAPFPAHDWPYEIAYEWGATFKALFLQRTC